MQASSKTKSICIRRTDINGGFGNYSYCQKQLTVKEVAFTSIEHALKYNKDVCIDCASIIINQLENISK